MTAFIGRFLLAHALVSILLVAPAIARDSGMMERYFSLYVGGGILRSMPTLTRDELRSKFVGWGGSAETGMEIPFIRSFGVNFSGQISQVDLLNSAPDPATIEKATLTGRGGKFGIFIGHLTLGGGARLNTLRSHRVSTESGTASTVLSGSSRFAFADLSFDVGNRLRFSTEVQYQTGKIGPFDLTEVAGYLKVAFLLGL